MQDFRSAVARAKPDEGGSSNPDPTMKQVGSKGKEHQGENMPPLGGEDIAPANETRSPAATQHQIKRDDARSDD